MCVCVQGVEDCSDKLLRTPGHALMVLSESPLRAWRAVRLACAWDLNLDPQLEAALAGRARPVPPDEWPSVGKELWAALRWPSAPVLLTGFCLVQTLVAQVQLQQTRQQHATASDDAAQALQQGAALWRRVCVICSPIPPMDASLVRVAAACLLYFVGESQCCDSWHTCPGTLVLEPTLAERVLLALQLPLADVEAVLTAQVHLAVLHDAERRQPSKDCCAPLWTTAHPGARAQHPKHGALAALAAKHLLHACSP